ncbi:biopolymer transport protein ExbB/TolQ [Rheinheimera pacifica]|uniref:MotA/TolQ/ExbB proton channel family protein n=1 Tax=Rheinheimera pacifica TaxID=173990 RepID=UPI000CB63DDF|nr:MotA/TolQ/ExbB proton channel family protein [Rheinheimera pacifica]MDR6985278.1 biopolymer transport protein ExbB/TolQ [Rheinheimera pacifica]PKM20960.1 MAG: flagellar motor protein MotA [Gammaproteobacteria bacterium HGW-Gammaproteobacteria-15]
MELLNGIVRFLQEGGVFIYPIAFILVLGIVIAVERWWFLRSVYGVNQRAMAQVQSAVAQADTSRIVQLAASSSAPILAMLASGVHRLRSSSKREDMEYAMEEVVLEYSLRLQKRTPFLATLANVATLLGLLGTIMGLIAAFSAVANADPSEKASLLSSSISVAMNTTAFGLITAIPLVFVHALLQGKTASIIDTMEMVGIKLMNSIAKQTDGGADDKKA